MTESSARACRARRWLAAGAVPAEAVGAAPGPETLCHEDVFWGGADDKGGALPSSAAYRSGFALPGVVDGFDVLCASSWTSSMNDCQMDFARAYLDGGVEGARIREIDEALMAWADEHGLERTEIAMTDNTRSFGISVSGDGAVATMLQWDPVSRDDGADEVQRHADLAGIPLDGADVWVSWQVCPSLQGWESPPPTD